MRLGAAILWLSRLGLKAAFIGLCSVILPSSAAAQDETEVDEQANDQSLDTIIVTGTQVKDPAKEARNLARTLLGNHRSFDVGARFNIPVCLAVHGVSDAAAQEISRRFYENARFIGLSVGGKNCKKNILIGFVDNISRELDGLLENDRWVFGNLQPSDRKKLVNQSGPTRAWHVSKMGNAEGVELVWWESSEIPGLYVYEDRSIATASRIRSSRTQLMKASVVLIERSSAMGKTLNQLTDFATMRAIAPVDVVQEGSSVSPVSILTLFNSVSAPQELTDFDAAFLRAYYASNGRNLYVSSTIQSVGLEFARRLSSKDGKSE